MNNNKTTKRALGSSIVALLICFTMLVGTTYAWFTDTVTSTGNVIKSGTLDVALTWSDKYDADDANMTWNDVEDENTDPIFAYELWEPGFTQVRYLKVENKGTLALKYKLQIVVHNETVNGTDVKLSDVIDVYYASSKVEVPDRDLEHNDNLTYLGTLTQYLEGSVVSGELLAKNHDDYESDYATLVLKMQESAGNEYQNLSIGTSFDIMLFATQLTHEKDSFDATYDADADFPKSFTASAPVVPGNTGVDILVYNDEGYKVASVNVPTAATVDGTENVQVIITETGEVPNFEINAGKEYKSLDIQVLGIKGKNENNAIITVRYKLPAGLDPATVEVYHDGVLIGGEDELPDYRTTYDPNDGYVSFFTKSFSPFTIVYDKDSTYVPPVAPSDELPEANVVNSPEYENVVLPWGSYGTWSPTEGLDSQLEAAYTFSCVDTPEQAAASPYANWYCDFYVKLDRDLAANQIFLGGNYGDFGWVGFHNGTFTLPANQELPLLGSVVTNDWTYADITSMVGTFICGVGDVDDALEGATFTVMLRLTNPEDATEFYNVATIEHKFTGAPVKDAIADDAALDSALAGATGDVNVSLSDGTYTLPSNIASENVTITGNGENTVFDFTQVNSANGANITFENLYFQGKNENVMSGFGIQNTTGTIIFRNCTFDGAVTNEHYGNVIYANCTFTGTGYITTYAVDSAKFIGCTFDKADSRALLVYSHGDNPVEVTVENCEFKAAAKGTTWNGTWTAAIEIDTTNIPTAGTSVTIKDCTYDEEMYSALYRDKSAEGKANAVIVVE